MKRSPARIIELCIYILIIIAAIIWLLAKGSLYSPPDIPPPIIIPHGEVFPGK